MVSHVVFCCLGMGFSRCDNVFNLAFPFLDSHGVVEFTCFGLAGLLDGFNAERGIYLNDIAPVHLFSWFRA